jgi:hypothetical protein
MKGIVLVAALLAAPATWGAAAPNGFLELLWLDETDRPADSP